MAQQGILTTTLGIGRDYNEDLMARLADAGLGHYYFVEDASHMTRIFQEEVESLSQVVARAAEVSLVPSPGVMIRQVVGYPSRNVGQVTVVPVGAVYAGKRADLLVRLTVDAGVAAAQAALLTVTTSWVETGTGQPGQDMRGLQATFTTDEHRVERSVVPEVVAKAEKVRTAEALELATEAYKQGKSDDARRILQTTKDKVEAFRGSAAGKKYAPQAASMLDDLDSFEAAAEAPAADMKVLEKKTKAKARSMKKH